MQTLIPSLPSFPPPPIISRRVALALSLSSPLPSLCPSSATLTSRIFLDISIASAPAGRITVALSADSFPAAAARFAALATGSAGVTFRRKEFVKIAPNFIQHSGIRSFGADADLVRRASGADLAADELVSEWAAQAGRCAGLRSVKGTVGIVVRDTTVRSAVGRRIVARRGRIEVEEEEAEAGPNGTEFVIATRDSPEMDEIAAAVGRVVEGMEVVEKIAGVGAVRDNYGSPYFRVAKLIGDKRAVVAERGFNRPYVKVVVTDCGLLMD